MDRACWKLLGILALSTYVHKVVIISLFSSVTVRRYCTIALCKCSYLSTLFFLLNYTSILNVTSSSSSDHHLLTLFTSSLSPRARVSTFMSACISSLMTATSSATHVWSSVACRRHRSPCQTEASPRTPQQCFSSISSSATVTTGECKISPIG